MKNNAHSLSTCIIITFLQLSAWKGSACVWLGSNNRIDVTSRAVADVAFRALLLFSIRTIQRNRMDGMVISHGQRLGLNCVHLAGPS